MEFAVFADRAEGIEGESADTETCERVTDLLRSADADLAVVARFVQGRVFPAWDSTTLDVGPTACYEAIARAAGPNVSTADVEERLAEVGDVGAVAASYDLGGQQGLGAFGGGAGGGDLTVGEVHDELVAVAAAEGSGSQDEKVDRLFGLFNRTSPAEARYLARLVLGEMRIGVGEGTVRDATAAAFDVPVDAVERALQVTNDYGRVARVARDGGVDGSGDAGGNDDDCEGLADLTMTVGRPVQAMLAQAGTASEALDDRDRVAVEWKYDGARVQLHYDGDETRVFSRNMDEVTGALPELVEFAEDHLDAPAVVDGEAVAVDDDGDPLAFQAILRRFRRKHDVERAREDVGVVPRFFDCLHADGDDLLDAPLTERRARLTDLLDDGLAAVEMAADADTVAAVERRALDAGHEGIMLKDPESTYSAGRRGKHWLKRKPDVETLDLVVTGAEWGEGRRATYLGTFQVAARTDDGFAPVGKVATGISDEELARLTDLLEPHVRSEDGQVADLAPEVVFEVGYEAIQSSPTYESGYALRFPRFVAVREDKAPADADTLDRVERLAG